MFGTLHAVINIKKVHEEAKNITRAGEPLPIQIKL